MGSKIPCVIGETKFDARDAASGVDGVLRDANNASPAPV
jgi:hypothetical protein